MYHAFSEIRNDKRPSRNLSCSFREVVHKVVGVVKNILSKPFPWRRGRCQGRSVGSLRWTAGRSAVPRTALRSEQESFASYRPGLSSLKNPSGSIELPQPCIRSSTSDHDSVSGLPFRWPGEAGCSINLSMDFRPPSASWGYPAGEPRWGAVLRRAASFSTAPSSSSIDRLS